MKLYTPIRFMAVLGMTTMVFACASDDAPDRDKVPMGGMKSPALGQATTHDRQQHLLTPESDEDLTAVTDAVLHARIAGKRKEIGRFMSEAVTYMLDHDQRDLSHDTRYQQLLRNAKQADTDMYVLERETERRQAAKAAN